MQRQRSFSFKPTRFLVFSFTISSSLIFLTFFTIWVTKSTPSIAQETHLASVAIQTLTGFSRNFSVNALKDSILEGAHLSKPENASGFSGISLIGESQRKKSESQVAEHEEGEGGGLNGNITTMEKSAPAILFLKIERADKQNAILNRTGEQNAELNRTGEQNAELKSALKDSILEGAHLSKPENASGLSGISLIGELQRKKNESQVAEHEEGEGGGLNGNITTMEKSAPAILFLKIERTDEQNAELKKIEISSDVVVEEKSVRGCDFTRGRWVYDESHPLYSNVSCPLIDEGFNCQGNGRKDKDYMKWRWQPQDCDIPRFNATKMLELMRGKRLVFVGDSINRNQWESMMCMLMSAVRDPTRVYETRRRRITKEKGNYSFKFVDYKCTVEYYVSHFLVHEGKARVGQKRVQALRIDSIDHGSSRWRGADILVFNTAHWWSHYKTKAGINYYQEAGQIHPRLDVSTAFRKALMTWGSWIDKYINPRKTQVFFRSSAPSHFRRGQWNSGGSCKEATQPLQTSSSSYSEKNTVAEEVIKQMKTPVKFLNITGLSDYRIDGHPSIYGRNSRKSGIEDCSHWCLPGIPDAWNELLFLHLLQ